MPWRIAAYAERVNEKLRWGERWTAKHPFVSFAVSALTILFIVPVAAALIGHGWRWPDWLVVLPIALIVPIGGVVGSRKRWRESERA